MSAAHAIASIPMSWRIHSRAEARVLLSIACEIVLSTAIK